MCTVEKILIKGIRSFSPDNPYHIEFYKPLTIIVGSNGAGKTTIIECLRNATTGELPPNTRQGQGFIHDPKVAGETEVKGQVKLQFRTATGTPVIVTRSYMLTQKKATMQFKSLDAALTAPNKETGERQTITYRCADLDRMVPTLMGVSKAVLENVIFVHQEESNWPLAEGKVLKEKFDDIFAATKYTKALEALRKLRSEKAGGQKESKANLETLKQVKDMAAHHQRELEVAKSHVAEGRQQIAQLEEEIKRHDEERAALMGQLDELNRKAASVQPKEAQLRMVEEQNKEREQRFQLEGRADFEEDSETLRQHQAEFDQSVADKSMQRDALRRELNSLRIEKEALHERHQQECVRQGKLAGEAATLNAHLADLDKGVRQTALALALPLPAEAGRADASGLGEPMSIAAVEAFAASVGAKVRELEGRLQAVKADHRANEERLTAAVDAANAQVAGAQEGLRFKRQQVEDNNNTISECHAQIYNTQMTAAAVRGYKEEAEEAEAAYKRKQDEEARSALPRQIAEHRAAAEAASQRLNELRAERSAAAAAAEGSARLRVKRMDLASKQEQLDNMVNARRLALGKLLELASGEALPPLGQLRARVDATLGRVRQQEAEQLAQLQGAQKEAQAAKNNHTAVKDQLVRREADAARLLEEIRGGLLAAHQVADLGSEDLNNRLQSTAEMEAKARSEYQYSRGLRKVYNGFLTAVNNGHPCPCCKRGLDPQEREHTVNALTEEMQTLPGVIQQRQAEAARLQQELDTLQGLLPKWTLYKDAREALPALQLKEAELRELAEAQDDKAEALQLDYAESAQKARELAKLNEEVVWSIDRLVLEVEALTKELAVLDAAAGQRAGAAMRTVGEVDEEMESVELTRNQAEQQRDMVQTRANRLREEVVKAQREAMAAQQRAMDATLQANRVAELQDKIKELEATNQRLGEALSSSAALLAPLEAERDRLVAQRNEARAAGQQQTAEVEATLREAVLAQSSLAAKLQLVSGNKAQRLAEATAAVTQQVQALQGQVDAAAAKLGQLDQDLQQIEKDLSQDEMLRRDVQDCLDLRDSKNVEMRLRQEVEALRGDLSKVGHQAELQARVQELSSKRDICKSRQDQLRGHTTASQAAANKAGVELQDPKYRDINIRFRDMQVLVKTTELALMDLDKYYKALEKALLVFHTSKMSDINKIIKEMWQKTYRGQDIDYIQIKADTEGAGTRSYNYRVVMYSGAAELEMRGRCSAGQKVLACLIIRLALAETFCLNCGILALDEPTTNLDAENSASLAEALRMLMVSRSVQENFQLIVITHDERFARLIGTREYTDSLWRVTKDASQHTQVIPEEVSDE